MAIVTKLLTSEDSGLKNINLQPAAGKFWWFSKLHFEMDLASAADGKVRIRRGATGPVLLEWHRWSDVGTIYDEDVSDSQGWTRIKFTSGTGDNKHPMVGEIPFRYHDSGRGEGEERPAQPGTSHIGADATALWASNTSYLRIESLNAGNSWSLVWFGIEADV
jgi:hypothetical protein